jgi:uncharacterized protein
MIPSPTDTLCTRCGLCCDGSLFSDVELAGPAEATPLELLGLDIEEDDADGSLLQQPCTALRGTRCSIYAHRPRCCMTFECQLLRDVRRGALDVARARAHVADARRRIRQTKALLAQLGQRDARMPLHERCIDALAMEPRADPEARRVRARLRAGLSAVERLIRDVFLGGGRA